MLPIHMSSTSRALYRVFVASNLRASTAIPLLYAPAFAPSAPSSRYAPSLTSRTSIRTVKYSKETRRSTLRDEYVIDAAITADYVNLVDLEGKFHADVPLTEALSGYNKVTHHLVEIKPGKVDQFGRPDPQVLPTCRVISKMDLRIQHERKLDILRRQAKGQTAGRAPKNLELNWAIAGGDLKHRLDKMKEFLKEGRKVHVMLGPKKKGKRATADEAKSVVKAIRNAVAECKGASEVKSEGAVGEVMTLVFEGTNFEEKREGADKNLEGKKNSSEEENKAA